MTEQQAKEDAANHYDMPEWRMGERDAKFGKKHKDISDSYNAGYSFSIWKQERANGGMDND